MPTGVLPLMEMDVREGVAAVLDEDQERGMNRRRDPATAMDGRCGRASLKMRARDVGRKKQRYAALTLCIPMPVNLAQ